MPKSIKKKIIKHSTPEKEFSGAISKLKQSVEERKKLLVGLTAAVIVLITAVLGFFIYDNSMKKKAAILVNEAYKAYYEPSGTSEEHYNKAAGLFKKAYHTKKSAFSLFYLANCQYQTGKFDESMDSFKELAKQFSGGEFAPLAYYKMALISMKKGNNADAIKYLDMLYESESYAFKDLSLLENARILEDTGKGEESLKKYEQLIKEFPDSPFIREALSKTSGKQG